MGKPDLFLGWILIRKVIKNKHALIQSFEIKFVHVFLKDGLIVLQCLYTLTLINLHKLFPATAISQTMHYIKTITCVNFVVIASAQLVNELLLIEQQMVYECLVSLHGVGESVVSFGMVN